MRRFAPTSLAIAALAIAGLALPACAQRGISHGGSSGRSIGAFHGAFAASHIVPAPRAAFVTPRFSSRLAATSRGFPTLQHGFARFPMRSFARPVFAMHRSGATYGVGGRYRSGFRSPYFGAEHRRGRHRRRDFYGVGVFGEPMFYSDWVGLGPYGYSFDDPEAYASAYNATWAGEGNDDAGGYDPQEYGSQPGPEEAPIYRNNYYGPPHPGYYESRAAEMPRPPQAPANESATTIIFSNGRAPEQIHDYALTGTMLYVLGQQRQDIPLDQIDIAATEKANRAAGIEFQVPNQTPRISR